MALIKCPDCGREISDSAPACIVCGRPNPSIAQQLQTQPAVIIQKVKPKLEKPKKTYGLRHLFLFILVFVILNSLFRESKSTSSNTISSQPAPTAIKEEIPVMTTGEIHNSFDNYTEQAIKKYVGNKIRLKGKILHRYFRDDDKNPFPDFNWIGVFSSGNDANDDGVMCMFDDNLEMAGSSTHRGNIVIVEGEVAAPQNDKNMFLVGCHIVE